MLFLLRGRKIGEACNNSYNDNDIISYQQAANGAVVAGYKLLQL